MGYSPKSRCENRALKPFGGQILPVDGQIEALERCVDSSNVESTAGAHSRVKTPRPSSDYWRCLDGYAMFVHDDGSVSRCRLAHRLLWCPEMHLLNSQVNSATAKTQLRMKRVCPAMGLESASMAFQVENSCQVMVLAWRCQMSSKVS